jgi:hypothetical protein
VQTERLRHRQLARDRRVHHADDRGRQYQRRRHHDRGEGGGHDLAGLGGKRRVRQEKEDTEGKEKGAVMMSKCILLAIPINLSCAQQCA